MLAYIEETPAADAPASAATPYNLAVGVDFRGVFTDNLDEVWVRVDLLAGKTYGISLAGADSNSQADTVLRIYNPAGEQVAVNDDADFDAGEFNSMLRFFPGSQRRLLPQRRRFYRQPHAGSLRQLHADRG